MFTEKGNEISENVQELMRAPEQILDCENLHYIIGTAVVTIDSNLQNCSSHFFLMTRELDLGLDSGFKAATEIIRELRRLI